MANVNDVADFFLSKEPMSQKKLQKLVYYAYAWTLALLNDSEESIKYRLFDSEIQAWVHGPVCPLLYQEYKRYGWEDIEKIEFYDEDIFQGDILDILNQVWDVYGKYTGNQLEGFTHQEDPWIAARGGIPSYASCDTPIDDRVIFKYYNEQAAE